jgi:osmotically-inducible protein OsmY
MSLFDTTAPSALDDALALQVQISKALADHPTTHGAVIEVIVDRGVVTLEGSVANAETRSVAEEVVSSLPGVISVTNALKIDAGGKDRWANNPNFP